jgi:hypothetical protein
VNLLDVFEGQGLSVYGKNMPVRGMSADGGAIIGDFIVDDRLRDGYLVYLDPLVMGILGDLNLNGKLESLDINILNREILAGFDPVSCDLNGDQRVDAEDRLVWVHDLANTYFGDANLDGEFNSTDLVFVFGAGEYEDNIDRNSTWSTGDWTGDGEFTTSDLVLAFQDGGYEGPRQAIRAVPEPNAWLLLVLGMTGAMSLPRHRHCRS